MTATLKEWSMMVFIYYDFQIGEAAIMNQTYAFNSLPEKRALAWIEYAGKFMLSNFKAIS